MNEFEKIFDNQPREEHSNYKPRSGQSKKRDFTEGIIITMLTLFVLFIIWVMIIFSRTGMEPATTVASVSAFVGAEFGLAAWLRNKKRQLQHTEDMTDLNDHYR